MSYGSEHRIEDKLEEEEEEEEESTCTMLL